MEKFLKWGMFGLPGHIISMIIGIAVPTVCYWIGIENDTVTYWVPTLCVLYIGIQVWYGMTKNGKN